MKRFLLFGLWLWLAGTQSVAQDAPVIIDVPNPGKQATAPKVVEHALPALASIFAVIGPDGKHVPAAYDAKAKMLRFLTEVPAGGGKYTVKPSTRSNAPKPMWKKYKFETEKLKIDDKKTIEWARGDIENGLLNVSFPAEKLLHGRFVITSLEGDYRLRMSPLGQSVGCVETQEIAKKVADDYAKGVQNSPELFFITPSIPTKIVVEEPNPFQRLVKVTCYDYARRNDDKTLKLFESAGYEMTLTWKSPIVQVKATRKVKTAYFNHNGVNLNEIYIDNVPISYANDGGELASASPSGRDKAAPLNFERAMMFRDVTGTTAVMQPDFKKLTIYKECVVLANDRIMTVQSQSWHEGWKAIEIKAGEYTDTVTLACNVGDKGKTVSDWEIELIGPPPPKEGDKAEPGMPEPGKEEPKKDEPKKEEAK